MARKLALLVTGALAVSVTLVGVAATAGAQDADGVPVHLVHGSPDAVSGIHPALSVFVDGDLVATLEFGTPVDIVVPAGTRTFGVEASDGAVPLPVPIPEVSTELTGGHGYTVVVSGDGTFLELTTEILVLEHDLSSIEKGVGRFTFNHAHLVLGGGGLLPGVSVDFGGAGSLDDIAYGEGDTIELPEARYDATVDVAGLVQEEAEIPIVGGVHVIATLIQGIDPITGTDQDVQIVFLVQELPVPDTDVETFCSTLLAIAPLGDELVAAIAGIGTADELDQDGWRDLFGRADALLDAGDRSRDLAVDDAWKTATAPLRMARAAFALVDYDLASEEGQQVAAEIQAATGGGAEPDPVSDAATAALTDYVLTTCLAAPAESEVEPPLTEPGAAQPTLPRTGGPGTPAAALAAAVIAAGGHRVLRHSRPAPRSA